MTHPPRRPGTPPATDKSNLFAAVFGGEPYAPIGGLHRFAALNPANIRAVLDEVRAAHPRASDVIASLVFHLALADDRSDYVGRDALECRQRLGEAELARDAARRDAANHAARAMEALNQRDADRRVIAAMEAACGIPDKGDALRRVLAVARGFRERAEVPDPWTKVTEDDASLPPAGETVLVWTAHGISMAWWGRDVVGNPTDRWDHDNLHAPQPRGYVLAWQRVAGPGWLEQEKGCPERSRRRTTPACARSAVGRSATCSSARRPSGPPPIKGESG